jgi:hypothetical protein
MPNAEKMLKVLKVCDRIRTYDIFGSYWIKANLKKN